MAAGQAAATRNPVGARVGAVLAALDVGVTLTTERGFGALLGDVQEGELFHAQLSRSCKLTTYTGLMAALGMPKVPKGYSITENSPHFKSFLLLTGPHIQ